MRNLLPQPHQSAAYVMCGKECDEESMTEWKMTPNIAVQVYSI